MPEVGKQLELLGLTETLRQRTALTKSGAHKARVAADVLMTHDIRSALPDLEDLSYLHSGLAQTFLPHSRPDVDSDPWMRRAGNFSLIVSPGVVAEEGRDVPRYVGVPYGTKARLILIYLQTEGVRSRTVSLGPNLSSFLRSLGLSVNGGKNGSINAVREQCLRIARCQFTMHWTGTDGQGRRGEIIQDTRIVDGLEMWVTSQGQQWAGTVELSARFQEHLKEHAVPLDKRALSKLADFSLGLDLYTLLAYRLPRLRVPLHLRWAQLQAQVGTDYVRTRKFAEKIRHAMPSVIDAYPAANVEVTATGLTLCPSPPSVPKTMVRGVSLVKG